MVKSIVHFPDNRVGWLPGAAWKARALVGTRSIDAVLSTAPPPSAHFAARAAVTGSRIPWVADYRDLWAGPAGPYFRHGSGRMRLALEYGVERVLLRRADAVTAASESHGSALAAFFDRPDVAVIPNAGDADAWLAIPDRVPSDFVLCYTGKLYPNLRTPDLLFAATAKLRATGDPAGLAARFEFYGEDPAMVAEAAERYGLSSVVRAHGEVPRRTAMEAQRGSAVLVLLLNTAGELDSIENANPGSKILEYAGAGRRILALGARDNAVRRTIEETGLGLYAADETECVAALRTLYRYFRAGDIAPALNGWRPTTPRELASGFASVLDRVTTVRRPTKRPR
jgi:hypothetical protein